MSLNLVLLERYFLSLMHLKREVYYFFEYLVPIVLLCANLGYKKAKRRNISFLSPLKSQSKCWSCFSMPASGLIL